MMSAQLRNQGNKAGAAVELIEDRVETDEDEDSDFSEYSCVYENEDLEFYILPPDSPAHSQRFSKSRKTHLKKQPKSNFVPVIIDSGCAPVHVISPQLAPAFTADQPDRTINMHTSGAPCHTIAQVGTLCIYTRDIHGSSVELRLPETLMSKDFASNLLSLRALLLADYQIVFEKTQAVLITPSHQKVVLTDDEDGMWILPSVSRKRNAPMGYRIQQDDNNSRSNQTVKASRSATSQQKTNCSKIRFGPDEVSYALLSSKGPAPVLKKPLRGILKLSAKSFASISEATPWRSPQSGGPQSPKKIEPPVTTPRMTPSMKESPKNKGVPEQVANKVSKATPDQPLRSL